MEKEKAPEAAEELAQAAPPGGEPSVGEPPPRRRPATGRTVLICSLVFLAAFVCRLLSWQDNRFEARKVQTMVTEGYKHTARLLREGGVSSFFSPSSPLADPNHLGHPPGYPVMIAAVFGLFGESDAALQIVQLLADSAAAVVVFLIALALFDTSTATVAGLLVALAPQFTYNSVMLLPDTLAVLPVLLAVYCLVRAVKTPRLIWFVAAGALVGLSCWLRANAMLLAPFMAAAIPLLFERGRRLRPALALVGGAVLVVAPLTVRNAIVYRHFVPVSLGAGQTFLEGIADYDDGSLGIPNTDMGLMKWEAQRYDRPDYYGTLFNPDGVRRDRRRLAEGFAVIRSRPFWFAGVMLRRAGSMLRLERVRLISADPPVTHSLAVADDAHAAWSASPQDLLAQGIVESNAVRLSPAADAPLLNVSGDDSRVQFTSPAAPVEGQTDYVLKLPVRIEQGRVMASVLGDGHEYASAIIEVQDWKTRDEQPLNTIELPFVSRGPGQVRLVLTNAGVQGTPPVLQLGEARLYALGPASFNWTRIPRAALRLVQKLFITAVMLPLSLFGLFLLLRARRRRALVLLLVVPAYYLAIQSALHTEYRYVLAIHHFLFILAAVTLCHAGVHLWRLRRKIQLKQS
ncbi:MAG TPA: glycosyltransferase family 39 protein [Pyrinomonadaceae bacterium]|nr:glycosyltransferase family 39 protein [Pyrinomonadaceae bacterium]